MVSSVTETFIAGYGFARVVTLRIVAFIVAANVIEMAATWISLEG